MQSGYSGTPCMGKECGITPAIGYWSEQPNKKQRNPLTQLIGYGPKRPNQTARRFLAVCRYNSCRWCPLLIFKSVPILFGQVISKFLLFNVNGQERVQGVGYPWYIFRSIQFSFRFLMWNPHIDLTTAIQTKYRLLY